MDDPGADRRQAAQDAALRSLVANLVSLGLMVGVSLALTRRAQLATAARRAWAALRRPAPGVDELAVSEFTRAVSDYSREA